MQTWKKACTNPIDQKVEEELRKVSSCPPSLLGHRTAPPRLAPLAPPAVTSKSCVRSWTWWPSLLAQEQG